MVFLNDEAAAKWLDGVKANDDPYGGRVYTYAEDWASIMDILIARGAKVDDIADKCSHAADFDGITGFMYGCAVSILAQAWKHGEALRRWHNLKVQVNDEGEKANADGKTLNPAILRIG